MTQSPHRPESPQQKWIQQRISDNPDEHTNLHPRDLAAMRSMNAEIQRLREALALYAAKDNWREVYEEVHLAGYQGVRARWTLKKVAQPWKTAADALEQKP